MDTQIQAALIGAGAVILTAILTAVVSYFTALFTVRAELRRGFESTFHNRRWEKYTQFWDGISDYIVKGEFEKAIEYVRKNRSFLYLVGSHETLKAFDDWVWELMRLESSQGPPGVTNEFNELTWTLIAEMRRDLGYTKGGKTPGLGRVFNPTIENKT